MFFTAAPKFNAMHVKIYCALKATNISSIESANDNQR
jgi:hypothetical protein